MKITQVIRRGKLGNTALRSSPCFMFNGCLLLPLPLSPLPFSHSPSSSFLLFFSCFKAFFKIIKWVSLSLCLCVCICVCVYVCGVSVRGQLGVIISLIPPYESCGIKFRLSGMAGSVFYLWSHLCHSLTLTSFLLWPLLLLLLSPPFSVLFFSHSGFLYFILPPLSSFSSFFSLAHFSSLLHPPAPPLLEGRLLKL